MKIKVTYIDFNGLVKAKIINSYGWYSIINEISTFSIFENQIIKIEKILEADLENIEDLTLNKNI